MGGAEGATHPLAVNGAFGAVSGLQNFLDFSQIEGLHFLIGNFLIAWRTVLYFALYEFAPLGGSLWPRTFARASEWCLPAFFEI